jgi:hypothetical protein
MDVTFRENLRGIIVAKNYKLSKSIPSYFRMMWIVMLLVSVQY